MARLRSRRDQSLFSLATGSNSGRTDADANITLGREIILTAISISVDANDGPVLVTAEIDVGSALGPVLASQWIRGAGATGGITALYWEGRVAVPEDARLFTFARNDTGSDVIITTEILFEET